MIRIVETSTLSVSIIVQPLPVPVIAVQQTAVNFGAIEAGQTGQQNNYGSKYGYRGFGDYGY